MAIKKSTIEKTADEIVAFFLDSKIGLDILSQKGKIKLEFAGIKMLVKKNDIVGSVIQEWFQKILDQQKIFNIPNKATQKFPDFYLKKTTIKPGYSATEGLCEIKSYNAVKTPAFDIANYDSYIEKLNSDVAILDTKYIIFAYKFEKGELSITNVYCKNIWEISGETEKESLKCQIKKGQVYNIRPVSFNSTKKVKFSPFASLSEFLIALYKFKIEQDGGRNIVGHTAWIEKISENYTALHGNDMVEKEVKKITAKKVIYKSKSKCEIK
jgi:hypothetical protein